MQQFFERLKIFFNKTTMVYGDRNNKFDQKRLLNFNTKSQQNPQKITNISGDLDVTTTFDNNKNLHKFIEIYEFLEGDPHFNNNKSRKNLV